MKERMYTHQHRYQRQNIHRRITIIPQEPYTNSPPIHRYRWILSSCRKRTVKNGCPTAFIYGDSPFFLPHEATTARRGGDHQLSGCRKTSTTTHRSLKRSRTSERVRMEAMLHQNPSTHSTQLDEEIMGRTVLQSVAL